MCVDSAVVGTWRRQWPPSSWQPRPSSGHLSRAARPRGASSWSPNLSAVMGAPRRRTRRSTSVGAVRRCARARTARHDVANGLYACAMTLWVCHEALRRSPVAHTTCKLHAYHARTSVNAVCTNVMPFVRSRALLYCTLPRHDAFMSLPRNTSRLATILTVDMTSRMPSAAMISRSRPRSASAMLYLRNELQRCYLGRNCSSLISLDRRPAPGAVSVANSNRSDLRCASTAVVHKAYTVVHLDIAHGVRRQNWLNPGLGKRHASLIVTSSES